VVAVPTLHEVVLVPALHDFDTIYRSTSEAVDHIIIV